MEKSQMKNTVVLKNLPSNLIEEAIIIFKSKKNAKKFEYIEKKETVQKNKNNTDSKNYIIREAESVISNYINSIESVNNKVNQNSMTKKYRKLKFYSIGVTIAFLIALFL